MEAEGRGNCEGNHRGPCPGITMILRSTGECVTKPVPVNTLKIAVSVYCTICLMHCYADITYHQADGRRDPETFLLQTRRG